MSRRVTPVHAFSGTSPAHSASGLAILLAGVGLTLGTGRLEAQHSQPTFTRDVAPILYANCTTCHRPGGLGPMSLLTYEGARRAATRMRKAVSTGYMPPWHAEAPHGTFRNDRRLSEGDKTTIVRWIDAGTPQGDPADLPPAPQYADSWTIGTPDVVLAMPEEYEVPARGTIEYQYFDVPTNFTEDRWVQSLEILPGAREVVHHVLVFARAPRGAAPAPAPVPAATPPAAGPPRGPLLITRRDHAIPPPSRGADGQPRPLGALIGTTAPGTNVISFPAGTAMRVPAGAILTFQMHYTAHGHAMKDRTSVGMVFAPERPAEEIRATSFQNGQFTIPPGEADYQVPAEVGFRDTVRVWGLFPHTHLRGTRWEYRLVHADGRSESILSVPRYDFNWQTYYMFATPLLVPAGARIESMAWYDNSTRNRDNPDPKSPVTWGDQTWEEMQYTGFLFTVGSGARRAGGSP